eukprot:CAMPEP_0173392962 /NCGR_PEP_ID=MMETSP1356-20130122/21830_1 /TAXON_ID=77927 ORGANISM="Hemiselmis virescens, Strain PCC157" /NCGR_SAMPLE_ID=MMETSP1356 /ASSEMBLY_ACC=CAM_ASM_000847 /LENGTH=656 /DNA_ID=CAMNT_0014350905 /DNA_START=198 /DNA_END=2164 /DNA_ORIENTATION=-
MAPASSVGKRAAAKKDTAKQAAASPIAKPTEKRKHTDMMKKRRRRGMTNELVKQLQDLLPPVSWTRCMHETLNETAKEMKRVLALDSKPSAASSSSAKPSSSAPKSKSAASAASAAPAATAPMEIDDSLLRQGMLLSPSHLRVAILSDKLEVLDASASFATLFFGRPVTNGAELTRDSLNELLEPLYKQNILSAMKYISTAKLDFETNRQVIVGLTVHHADGKSSLFPVEIVPLPSAAAAAGGRNTYMVTAVAPKADQAGAVIGCVQGIVDRLGGEMDLVFEEGSKCVTWSSTHAVDSRGGGMSNPVAIEMDPPMIMLQHIHRMVCEGTLPQFDEYMKHHPSAVTVVWKQIREGLKCDQWDLERCRKESMIEFSTRIMLEAKDVTTGMWRTFKGNIACYQCRLNGVPTFETWMSQPVRTDFAKMTMTSLALLYPGTLENGVNAIALEDGSVWWYMPEPQAMPAKAGGMNFMWSGILKVDFGNATASVGKSSFFDDEVSHMTRRMTKSAKKTETVGDFPLFCHFLGVMERWSPSMSADHLKVSRFNNNPSRAMSREGSIEPQTVLASENLTLPSPWESSSLPLLSVAEGLSPRAPSRGTASSSGSMELSCMLNSSGSFGFGDFARQDSSDDGASLFKASAGGGHDLLGGSTTPLSLG